MLQTLLKKVCTFKDFNPQQLSIPFFIQMTAIPCDAALIVLSKDWKENFLFNLL
jgi:hypothetical protein